MGSRKSLCLGGIVLAVCVILLVQARRGHAGLITSADFFTLDGDEDTTGSGNGNLDMILFHDANSGVENDHNGFDGDDSCTDMAKGGTSTTSESYITSMGEIREYYRLNYPDGEGGSTVIQMILCLDLNQTSRNDLVLDNLVVVVDYDATFGDARDDPASNDISTSLQNATGSGYSGGAVVAELDSPETLPVIQQGAGFADYGIALGIDPFDDRFADTTRLLIYWESSGHDAGGESVFLSGEYGHLPEPATWTLLALGGAVVVFARRRWRRP